MGMSKLEKYYVVGENTNNGSELFLFKEMVNKKKYLNINIKVLFVYLS